jgi:hypothetical protein
VVTSTMNLATAGEEDEAAASFSDMAMPGCRRCSRSPFDCVQCCFVARYRYAVHSSRLQCVLVLIVRTGLVVMQIRLDAQCLVLSICSRRSSATAIYHRSKASNVKERSAIVSYSFLHSMHVTFFSGQGRSSSKCPSHHE